MQSPSTSLGLVIALLTCLLSILLVSAPYGFALRFHARPASILTLVADRVAP